MFWYAAAKSEAYCLYNLLRHDCGHGDLQHVPRQERQHAGSQPRPQGGSGHDHVPHETKAVAGGKPNEHKGGRACDLCRPSRRADLSLGAKPSYKSADSITYYKASGRACQHAETA